MRGLTKKQKKLLDDWYEKNKDKVRYGIRFFDLGKCSFFPYELYEELEKINDFETIYQAINCYISDKEV